LLFLQQFTCNKKAIAIKKNIRRKKKKKRKEKKNNNICIYNLSNACTTPTLL